MEYRLCLLDIELLAYHDFLMLYSHCLQSEDFLELLQDKPLGRFSGNCGKRQRLIFSFTQAPEAAAMCFGQLRLKSRFPVTNMLGWCSRNYVILCVILNK